MDGPVAEALKLLRDAVARLSPEQMRAADAERLVELFAEGERLCQAGRTLAAQRVLQTRYWRAQGFRTPGQWLADRTKAPLGQAITSVETASRLGAFPETRTAFVSGTLSETQAAAITAAAAADPAAERSLLLEAQSRTVSELRERCREVRAAALADEDVAERLRRQRYCRHWSDRDGAVRLDARLAPDDGARLIATIEARAAVLQETARRSGQRETAEAYAADALVGLTEGAAKPKAVVHVHVDRSALERGRTVAGETCKIERVGPVPVATARRFLTDAFVKALHDEGADVRAVAHLGRSIPARVRTALEARDPTCAVPSCEVAHGLEIDHIVPLSAGGETTLSNLVRLCRYHHAQKTHRGWRLEGEPGRWRWVHRRAEGGSTAPEAMSPPRRDGNPEGTRARAPNLAGRPPVAGQTSREM